MEDNRPPLNNQPPQDPVAITPAQLIPKKKLPSSKPLRTYEGDVAEVLAKRNTSSLTMALAESKKKQGRETLSSNNETENSRVGIKLILLLSSLVLIVGGGLAAYYFYSISPLSPSTKPIDTTPAYKSLIPSDSQSSTEVRSVNSTDIIAKIKSELAKDQPPNTIRELILVTMTTSTNSDNTKTQKLTRIPIQTIITNLGIKMPDILYRSLNKDWMLGIYANNSGQKSAFVIVTNDFYQNIFSGMLQWENLMADDLKDFIILPNAQIIPDFSTTLQKPAPTKIASSSAATSSSASSAVVRTSTSTEQGGLKYFVIHGQFADKIIKNKDIREFSAPNGDVIFLYSFLDNNRLIFTVDESLITEIMSRLERQAYVR